MTAQATKTRGAASGRPRPRAITAAAARISLKTKAGRALIRKPDSWQREAWAFFRAVTGVTFAAGFTGNAMSRIRLYPGIVLDPDDPPVPLTDAVKVPGSGVTEALAQAADEELAHLANSPDGIPGLMRGFGVNLSIGGEAYLIGRPPLDDDPLEEERWGVYSASAITKKGDQVLLRETKGGKGTPLGDDDFVARIWRRDAEFPGDPWSNMISVLGDCEELVIWARVFRAVAKSAANGGILTMPSQLDPEAMAKITAEEGVSLDDLTDLQRSYLEHVTQSIETDDTASAAAPWVLDGDYQYLDRVLWIDTTRKIDPLALQRVDHLHDNLAHGLDLPIEVVKGIGDLNHWSGWLVSDDTYRAHLEPTAKVAAHGLGAAYLRPGLAEHEGGFPLDVVRRVVVGLDPSDLVGRPNRGVDARDAYDRGELSGEGLRALLGIPEAFAPDVEEALRRVTLTRGLMVGDVAAQLINALALPEGMEPLRLPAEIAAAASADGGEGSGTPAEDGTPAEEGGDALPATDPAAALRPPPPVPLPAAPRPIAAAAADPFERMAANLAGIDQRLLARLQVAASDDVNQALRVAGNRLRSKVQHHPEARELARGKAPEQVGQAIGVELGAQLADQDWLLEGSLTALRDRWDDWVSAGQAQMAGEFARVADEAPDPADAADGVAELRAGAEADRAAGWAVLAGALEEQVAEQLWRGAAQLVDGEWDRTVSVPAGTVRNALAVAGGADPADPYPAPMGSVQQSGPGGLAAGAKARKLLRRMGAVVLHYRWDAGTPTHPFPPHHSLNGVEFQEWGDQRLAATGPFPSVASYYPGDHRGCQCSAVPVARRAAGAPERAVPEPETVPELVVDPAQGTGPLADLRRGREAFAGTEAPSYRDRVEDWTGRARKPSDAMRRYEDQRYEIGRRADEIIEERVRARGLRSQAEADEARRVAEAEFKAAEDAYNVEIARKRPRKAQVDRLYDDYMRTQRSFNLARRDQARAGRAYTEASREELFRLMDEMGVRRGGVDSARLVTNADQVDDRTRAMVVGAFDYYPTSWLESAADSNAFEIIDDPEWAGRAYMRRAHRGNRAQMNFDANNEAATAVHEFGHHIERTNPHVAASEWTFYWRRVGTEDLRPLNEMGDEYRHYAANEVSREDEFMSAYMGKDYGADADSGYELVSMIAEGILAPPEGNRAYRQGAWTVDHDMRRWFLGLLMTA